MKAIALGIFALSIAACGIVNDGNRRYACRSTDDCFGDSECLGVEQVARGERGCPNETDGGVPYFSHDGDDNCYYMYCVAPDRAECNGKKCDSGDTCAIQVSTALECTDQAAVDSAVACEDWVEGSCNGDAAKQCVLSFALVAKRFAEAMTDPFKAKVCVAPNAIHR